jgi:hypothetical protein
MGVHDLCGRNPVSQPSQTDVHQYEVWSLTLCDFDSLFACGRNTNNLAMHVY